MAKRYWLKMTLKAFLVAFFIFTLVGSCLAECGADCRRCHSVTMGQISKALHKFAKKFPGKIISVEPSTVKGLWKVDFVNNGQKGYFLIDYSFNNLIAGVIVSVPEGQRVSTSGRPLSGKEHKTHGR